MHITFAPGDILQIDDARIIHRNFAGAASKFNSKGDRNFSLVIDCEETADELIAAGWNVKKRDPEEEGDTPFMFLPVKVKFNGRGPIVRLKSGNARPVILDEESVECLDNVDILSVDLDIRPYDWELPSGKTGRTAYLQSIVVHQRVDRFAARYDEE